MKLPSYKNGKYEEALVLAFKQTDELIISTDGAK